MYVGGGMGVVCWVRKFWCVTGLLCACDEVLVGCDWCVASPAVAGFVCCC